MNVSSSLVASVNRICNRKSTALVSRYCRSRSYLEDTRILWEQHRLFPARVVWVFPDISKYRSSYGTISFLLTQRKEVLNLTYLVIEANSPTL
jgi:hypothetical protein